MASPIRKVVFPVAGLGTRFLPATRAVPKEMIPVVDKPLIQYAVEEAAKAGITLTIPLNSGMSCSQRERKSFSMSSVPSARQAVI